jgi:hypothetical protein
MEVPRGEGGEASAKVATGVPIDIIEDHRGYGRATLRVRALFGAIDSCLTTWSVDLHVHRSHEGLPLGAEEHLQPCLWSIETLAEDPTHEDPPQLEYVFTPGADDDS